jgi:hypothetical protein
MLDFPRKTARPKAFFMASFTIDIKVALCFAPLFVQRL